MIGVRARAPLRLGFAGGGTDLSPFCDLHGGAILNVTIDRFAYCHLEVASKESGGQAHFRAADIGVESLFDVADLRQPREIDGLSLHIATYNRISEQFLDGRKPPVRMVTTIDAPPGSGLGSSSALCVAMVEAFGKAFDLPLGQYDVARIAFEIERIDLGLAGGRQDQYAAAFGGFNYMEFLQEERVIVNPLRIPESVVRELEASVLICFTGVSRSSDIIIRDQIKTVKTTDLLGMESLQRLKTDAAEMKQALLKGELGLFSEILDRSWQNKKNTSASISNSHIEEFYELARRNGATAGKVSGAGGGGFMMFMVDPADRIPLANALAKFGGVASPVYFTQQGAVAWHTRT